MPEISPNPLSKQDAVLSCIKAAARHCAGVENVHADDKDDYPCRLDARVPVDGQMVKATFFFKNPMQRGIASTEISIRLGKMDPTLSKAFSAEVINTAPKRESILSGLGEDRFPTRSRGEPVWLNARLERLSGTGMGTTPDGATKAPSAGSGKRRSSKGVKSKNKPVVNESVTDPEDSAISAEGVESGALEVELREDFGASGDLPVETGLEGGVRPVNSRDRLRPTRVATHPGLNALKNAILETCYNRGLQFLGRAIDSMEVGNVSGQPAVTIQLLPRDFQLRLIVDPKRADFKELVAALEQKIHEVSDVDRYRKLGQGEFFVTVKP